MNAQPLEVYMYYAALERAREDADTRPVPDSPITILWKRMRGHKERIAYPYGPPAPKEMKGRKLGALVRRRKRVTTATEGASSVPPSSEGLLSASSHICEVSRTTTEKPHETDLVESPTKAHAEDGGLLDVLSPPERESAYRLMRVASWQLVFFLITTDVLGWYTAPMAFAQLGYGPGVLIYTCFYLLAFCSGQILWRMYMAMDSEVYPIKCYADLGERTYGPVVRHVFNVLQSLQLVVSKILERVPETGLRDLSPRCRGCFT